MSEKKCRAIVRERSEGLCELCGVLGVQMHHRRNRSQGGRWDPSNIVLLCIQCHLWIGLNIAKAKQLGLTVQGTEAVPAHTPVTLYIGAVGREPRTVLLTDDGQLIDQEVPFGEAS